MSGKRPPTLAAPGERDAKRPSRVDKIHLLHQQIAGLEAELATTLRKKEEARKGNYHEYLEGQLVNDTQRMFVSSNQTSANSISPFRFKDLPRELRDEVYRHIIHASHSTLFAERPSDPKKPGAIGGHPYHQAILLVDRQLKEEVVEFMKMYGQLTFQFGCRNEAICTKCDNCQTNHLLDGLWWVEYTLGKDVQLMIQRLCNRYHHVYIELAVNRQLAPEKTKRLHCDLRWFLGQYGHTTRYSTDFTTGGQCRTIIDLGSLFRTQADPMYLLLADVHLDGRARSVESPPPFVHLIGHDLQNLKSFALEVRKLKLRPGCFSIICDIPKDEVSESSEVSQRFNVLKTGCKKNGIELRVRSDKEVTRNNLWRGPAFRPPALGRVFVRRVINHGGGSEQIRFRRVERDGVA
ncbi:hypothetical protein BU16DRAFT_543459 [Lophium mytilinum]|uniref:Uncharacterized protein n=1 Tax=Lophium mytilinum TaxID=390894 RepID=A0A6A6QGB3_9PEZI|nr:hypothetical protein BU16DRAFT_543459 [Lophium mytilinum]